METGAVNLQQSSVGDDDDVEAKVRYQMLLGDYLQLQKQIVSKKRKMRNLKKKRCILKAEVRFLRKRREDIQRSQSSMFKKRKLNQCHTESTFEENPSMENRIEMDMGNQVSLETQLLNVKNRDQNQRIHSHSHSHSHSRINAAVPIAHPLMERKTLESETMEKMSKNMMVIENTGKMGKKKRVTWQDQVVPKV